MISHEWWAHTKKPANKEENSQFGCKQFIDVWTIREVWDQCGTCLVSGAWTNKPSKVVRHVIWVITCFISSHI
jgi:hypothetical protein